MWHLVCERVIPLHEIDDISLADADAASRSLIAWNLAQRDPKDGAR